VSQSSFSAGSMSCPLAKRNVAVPPNSGFGNDIDIFLRTELDNAANSGNILENRVSATELEPVRQGYRGLSSSKRLIFGPTQLTAGAVRQRGCTTVYVVSKQGMRFAHLWEAPAISFIFYDEDGEPFGFSEPDPSIFFNDVISFINLGDGTRKSRGSQIGMS
jgi:hypothetical protein